MLLALTVLACAPHPAPAPAAPEAPSLLEEVRLTLVPADLTYDDAAGTATFRPGSAVQAASYDVFVFDLMSFEGAIGGRPTGPVEIVAALGPARIEIVTPSDPTLPSPAGGFRYTTRTGRVLRTADGR
jgi:hypothetical protein